MYQTLVFVVTFVLLCDIRVIISKPLAEEQQKLFLVRENEDLNVEALSSGSKSTEAHDKSISFEKLGKIVPLQKVVIKSEVSKQALNDVVPDRYLNSDTKKHYYLFKVREYYDFLPLYRQNSDRFSGLEIVDRSDFGYPNRDETIEDDSIHSEHLVRRSVSVDSTNEKRNVSDGINEQDSKRQRGLNENTLKDFLNVLQANFVKKRDVNQNEGTKAKRDLGNFYLDRDVLSGDPDDPQNNNYKYVAYVPFFRVRKYYLHRKRLDIGA